MRQRRNYLPLLLVFLISVGAFVLSSKVAFNYDFESFFKQGDDDVAFYKAFRSNFEDDSDFVLIALEHKPSVFDSLFLSRTAELSIALKSIRGVKSVLSPTNLNNVIVTPLGPVESPFVHYNNPVLYKSDSILIFQYPDLIHQFFSQDGTAIMLVLKIDQSLTPGGNEQTMKAISSVTASSPLSNIHLSGKLVAEQSYIGKTKDELVFFTLLSFILIVSFLLFTYRSLVLTVIPLFVIGLAIVWTIAVMVIFDKQLDLMMSLMPSIMFVVGMSDVIHFYSKFIEELRKGVPKDLAIRATVNKVGKATFLTSITTGVGFLTLYFIDIKPIREFGLYCGVGVMITFLITILTLPALLRLLPKPKMTEVGASDKLWTSRLSRLFSFVLTQGKGILLVFLATSGLAIMGCFMVKVDTKLIDDLREDDPLKVDFNFIDKKFSGSRPFEIALGLGDSATTFFDQKVLVELEKLDHYLTHTYGLKVVQSPLSFVKAAHRANYGGDPNAYLFINDERILKKDVRLLKRNRKSEAYRLFINEEKEVARLSGKMSDLGSLIIEDKNLKLQSFIDQNISKRYLTTRITGSALLIDENNKDLSQNMIVGLLVALAVIGLIMGVLFKSWLVLFISLIPNVLPLVLLGAILGCFSIPLKLSTSIVFTIAFGIAVDDTIHFMSRYRIERLNGRSSLYALKRTFISTGKALIVTSFIVSAGFLTLLFSDYMGTFYTGLFVSITLIFALVADMLLLPLLIFLFKKHL